MTRPLFIVGVTLVLLCSMRAIADEPKEEAEVKTIPLDQIWGYNLPDTRDIAGIPFPDQPDSVGQTYAFLNRQREYNIEQIRLALSRKPPGEKALSGFVVPAQLDSRSLLGVYQPLRGKPNPFQRNSIPEGKELTLVFFSYPISYHARLRKVEQQGNEITVHYQFEPHYTPEATAHFALIPLGKLRLGEYHVSYKQIPIEQKYRDAGFEPVHPDAAEIVCRKFSFNITGPSSNESLEGGTFIPLHEIWAYKMPGTRDVRELEPKPEIAATIDELARHSDVWKILKVLDGRPKEGEKAGPAFVVVGTGREALVNAAVVITNLMKEKESPTAVPPNTDVSLMFYSHLCGRYVQLVSVELSPQLITIRYRFVDHVQQIMTAHFALVPLGKLREGKVQVKVEQLPPIDECGQPVAPLGDPLRFVSQSFSFAVQKP